MKNITDIDKKSFLIPVYYFTQSSYKYSKLILFSLFVTLGCNNNNDQGTYLKILLDQPPLTLNPRNALDLNAQKITPLLYRGLTKFDRNLKLQSDLAEKWQALENGKTWKFWIKPGQTNHEGKIISAEQIKVCLEEYRIGKPWSVLGKTFSDWIKTETDNHGALIIYLKHSDPYFARNASVLRYFTSPGHRPCEEPIHENQIIGSGLYRLKDRTAKISQELNLVPVETSHVPLKILFVRDEVTRSMTLMRGEADAAQNALSLTKTRWFQTSFSNDYLLFEKDGTSVSYLAFNLKDPILSKKEIRQAIALSIDRQDIVKHKFHRFCQIAGSLLSPLLDESVQVSFAYNPALAEQLLDQSGYTRQNNGGIRFTLTYKTTPVREGYETALMFKEMLKKVGINLVLTVVEPAVFLASVKKGNFQLFSSRWVGVADGSILFNTLHSKQKNNRVFYNDLAMDQWLEQAMQEVSLEKRKELLKLVQIKMGKDLPYFPLWYWNNALLIKKEKGKNFKSEYLSIKGALEPLTEIQDSQP